MEGFGVSDVIKLAEILAQPECDSDNTGENPKVKYGDRVNVKPTTPESKGAEPHKTEMKISAGGDSATNSQDIWDPVAIAEETQDMQAELDPRIRPQFEIIYKQMVTPEDIYLQLGNKGPSSASCEAMMVKIPLPGESMREINLDIQRQLLDLRSPRYRLALPLPHPVDCHSGNAAFDSTSHTLTVTLYMNREFDFVNF